MAAPNVDLFRVTLLGTGAPPPVIDRFGPSTLVEVGSEKFIFDAGRGAMQRLHQLGIPFSEITGLFLTHHHSDHVVGFADLWLTGWIGRPWGKRRIPLKVWGPEGTRQMMQHLPLAFAVDLRVRSKSYPIEGATLDTTEIKEGAVYQHNDITMTAFEVDHGGEELPAFGYRIDFQDRSVVLSGDTTYNDNLIRYAEGVDLIVHEVTAASTNAVESPDQLRRISSNHTTPEQAGRVFSRTSPKLAVYNHLLLFGSATTEGLIPATRKNYQGRLVVGEDLLQITLDEDVTAQPARPSGSVSAIPGN